MPQPLLHHIQCDTSADGLHAEAMPQALGAGMRASRNACHCNDLLHPPEGGHAAPRPKQRLGVAAALRLPDTPTTAAAERHLAAYAGDVARIMVERALQGDPDCARVCLDFALIPAAGSRAAEAAEE